MIKNYNRIYFLGIGGIGMSSLAFYFINENKYVAGYDKVNSDITKSLSNNGAKIHFTDNYLSIPSQFLNQSETLVVYTPAISKFNKEYKYFKDNGFEILKRSELLGLISKDKFCIAIGGTHGKTTTSTILSHILLENNISFTSFIGGISENYNTNFIQNGNDIILVEADEFDRSFHTLFPNIACVTSTDSDHLDIYNSEQELKKSFIQFTDNIKSKGLLFSNEKTLLGGISYGFSSESEYFISNYSSAKYSSFFDINHNGSLIASVKFNMPGKHNALNALAAFAIGKELNIDYKSTQNIPKRYLSNGMITGNKPKDFLYDFIIEVTSFDIKVGNSPSKTVKGNTARNNSKAVADINSQGRGTVVRISNIKANAKDGDFINPNYIVNDFIVILE